MLDLSKWFTLDSWLYNLAKRIPYVCVLAIVVSQLTLLGH